MGASGGVRDPSDGFDPDPGVTVYRGRRLVVLARHTFLEAHARLVIDGVLHDPAAEKRPRREPVDVPRDVLEATDGAASGEADGLAFTVSEGLGRTVIQVRRPRQDGSLEKAERVHVRTRGVGGVGEVDVTDSNDLHREPLVPDPGSASAAREERKAAHPVRFALVAAAVTAARFLVPLLGLGALFSWLLDPVSEAAERVIAPPVRWLGGLLQPIGDAIDRVLGWLLGWIPALHLDLPDWVADVALPVVVVLIAGLVAYGRIRHRARRLQERRTSEAASSPSRESDDGTTH